MVDTNCVPLANNSGRPRETPCPDSPPHGWLRGFWGLCLIEALIELTGGAALSISVAFNYDSADRLRSKNKALTVEELADLLGVAIRTVYKEVEDKRIPFFRVRSSIRFDPHQVADWLAGKMVE
jgi:excisionase family DNA binding protein